MDGIKPTVASPSASDAQELSLASELPGGSRLAANPPGSGEDSGQHGALPGPASATKYRILIVDDEPAVLQVLQDMLSAQGYETVAFSSPSEALKKAKRQKFDALVLDLYMPEMSGMLFHAKVRVFDPWLAEHTVFISGYVSREQLRSHLVANSHFLEKPFKAGDFDQIVRKALPERPRE